MTKKSVAKKGEAKLPAQSAVDYLQEYQGEGTRSTTEEMSLPFLRIIESTSPQMKRNDPNYNKEAEPGDFVNTVTQELFSGEKGVALVPGFKRFEYPMFKVRESGGGFVGMTTAEVYDNETERDKDNRDILKGNPSVQVVRSGTTYCLMLDVQTRMVDPVIVGCAVTRLRAWKDWNTQIGKLQVQGPRGLFKPPIFGVVWHATTITKSNSEGEWNIPVFRPHASVEGLIGGLTSDADFQSLLLDRDIAMQALELGKAIQEGEVRAAYESEETSAKDYDPETGEVKDEESPI